MTEYVYKHLSAGDVPVLKSLLAVFGEAFAEPETYQGAVPSDAYLRALLAKPHFIALAALDGDAVVGAWPPTNWRSSNARGARSTSTISRCRSATVEEAWRRVSSASSGASRRRAAPTSCSCRRTAGMPPPFVSMNLSGPARTCT